CLPLGIVGIINAVKVNDMVQMGNYDLAEKYSNDAKKWINWGVIISLGIIFIYFIIAMIAAASI
ncbi:MAG: CD225/dispanin family protein, partial [Bacteroides sp.]|nr:CD225/dispanin family protein [Bacteroides sp.]